VLEVELLVGLIAHEKWLDALNVRLQLFKSLTVIVWRGGKPEQITINSRHLRVNLARILFFRSHQFRNWGCAYGLIQLMDSIEFLHGCPSERKKSGTLRRAWLHRPATLCAGRGIKMGDSRSGVMGKGYS
jgi:hypothetical protein